MKVQRINERPKGEEALGRFGSRTLHANMSKLIKGDPKAICGQNKPFDWFFDFSKYEIVRTYIYIYIQYGCQPLERVQ